MSQRSQHRFLTGLMLLALASAALAGCTLFGAPDATPAPTDDETTLPAATMTLTATPGEIIWEPIPTLPAAPTMVEVIELAGPPAPGLGPQSIALLGERVYTANEESRNLSIIQGGAVRSVLPLEQGPYRLVADPAREQLYVLNQFGRSILVVGGEELVAHWALPFEPTAGTLVDDQLWIGAMSGELARLDVATGIALQPAPPPIQGMIQDLALAEGRVLVGSHQQVALYDAQSLQPVAGQPVAGYRALAVAGEALYLCTDDLATGATWLERWELAGLTPQARLAAPGDTGAIWVDAPGQRAVLTGATTHRLYLLDLATGATLLERTAGLAPRSLAYDAGAEWLYVTHSESHTVVVVAPEDLSVSEITPTALQITALAAGPEPGSLLVGLSTGEVRLLRRQGAASIWPVGVYPGEVGYVPALDRVAVVDRALGELLLLERDGSVWLRHATGPNPRSLYIDAQRHTIYAGDLRFNWVAEPPDILGIPAGLAGSYPPVGLLRDTRRDHLYAIAWNGIPGSNGGYRIVRERDGVWNAELPAPGRLSVIEAAYDERTDRFYSTHAHMGQFGLEVSEGETLAEAAYLALDRYPQAMLLNAELWRLWLALPAAPGEPAHTRLLALDTRTLSPAATLQAPDRIARMALDAATQRLYLAAQDEARIYVVQDVALPAPPAPTATPGVTVAVETATATATATPEPTGTLTPPASPTRTATTPVPPPTATPTPAATECAHIVYPDLYDVWERAAPGGLGCAHGPAQAGQWGWQAFQNGELFWFDATRQILILYADGTWTIVDDQWREGMPDLGCDAAPPQGLWQPIRGFGLAWCQEPGLRERLGWALGSEQAFESLYQAFAGGSLITHPRGGAFWLDRGGTYYRIYP
jgi:DNA-binding beta-propeller fold protein YncE